MHIDIVRCERESFNFLSVTLGLSHNIRVKML